MFRATGGVLDPHLFDEQPLFGNGNACVQLELTLKNPKSEEIGLLMLALKDLWTGDLPVGGGANVGRGRLQGVQATLTLADGETCEIQKTADGLQITGKRQRLEDGVMALNKHLKGEAADGTKH